MNKTQSQNLTYEVVTKEFPHLSRELYDMIMQRMDEDPNFTSLEQYCTFLACTGHETGGFTVFRENLNYSYKRLLQVFKKYFSENPKPGSNKLLPKPYVRNPKALAEVVYGNRMGNTMPGDGYKYIGRGLIQLTGKINYMLYASDREDKIPVLDPDKLATDLFYIVDSAFWFWNKCQVYKYDDLATVNRIINGGMNGYPQRKGHLNRLLQYANKQR